MTRWTLGAIFVVLLASRLAHINIIWVEEGYPAAAAVQILDSGKTLYKDIWFDKPAGTAYLYCLWGARSGLALRLADSIFIFACCLLLYSFGNAIWGTTEGLAAAGLLAIYLTFGIPASVMALAPDLALVLPHIAAVYLAFLQRPLWAGVLAGVGFWINTKALFVVASCALFLTPGFDWLRLAAGFGAITGLQISVLAAQGSLADYYDQVWRWGAMYARDTFVEHPFSYGLRQTANWCGFQSAAVAGAILQWKSCHRRVQFAGWMLLSLIPVALGLRFFPRYYFQLLPVFALLGARGFALASKPVRWLLLTLALIPVIRFGPRYVILVTDLAAHRPHNWTDLAIAQDSERVAAALAGQPTGSLFVWGYRPDIYALTRFPTATQFLDSQPISGVLADRHLHDSNVSAPQWAARNQDAIRHARPDYIVDGLSRLNPDLAMPQAWLVPYEIVADTGTSVVYRRLPNR